MMHMLRPFTVAVVLVIVSDVPDLVFNVMIDVQNMRPVIFLAFSFDVKHFCAVSNLK